MVKRFVVFIIFAALRECCFRFCRQTSIFYFCGVGCLMCAGGVSMLFCGGNKLVGFCCPVLQQTPRSLLHDKISVLTKLFFFVVYVWLRCFYLCLRHLSLRTRTQSMQNCANRLTHLCGETDRRTFCRDDISIFGAVIGERFAFLCGGERRFGLIVRIWVAGCRVCPAVYAHRNVLLCL